MLVAIALIVQPTLALDRLLSLGMIPLKPKPRATASESSSGGGEKVHHPKVHRSTGGSKPADDDDAPPPVLARVTPAQAYREAADYLNRGFLDQGVKRLREAADGGYRDAQFAMATYFLQGQAGVPVSMQTANHYYLLAAKQGEPQAMFNIAVSYANGDAMAQNLAEAFKWFLQAANAGVSQAQLEVAKRYDQGIGVRADHGQAVAWYKKAADGGSAEAKGFLSDAYRDGGEGVKANDSEAVKLLREAAEGGDAQAMNDLGVRYLYGDGVPTDKATARKWIMKAVRLGNESAINNEALVNGK